MCNEDSKHPLNIALRKSDDYFYISFPAKKNGEKSVLTPRLSQIVNPEIRKILLDGLTKSAIDGGGIDLIFDISEGGQVIGVEFLF